MTWGSARLYRELEAHGLLPNKSARLIFPNIAEELLPHFVRGLIDSDGSFHRKGAGPLAQLLAFSYASLSEAFMHRLRDVLVAETKLSAKVQVCSFMSRGGRHAAFSLKYSHKDAQRLGQWAYAGSSEEIRGNRKYLRWFKAAVARRTAAV